MADFEEFEAEWVTPLSSSYRDWTVHELPPNGQGVAALEMLNIMENFPMSDYGAGSAAALHVMIEAKKLAYADLVARVGDPRFERGMREGVDELVGKALARERAMKIDMQRAASTVLPSELKAELESRGSNTIYLSAVDRDGMIVSLIQSNYNGYGTGLVAPGLGFSLQNRGCGFELSCGQPNSLQPRKRPLHTIIPALMHKGDVSIGFGIMGGWNQSQAHAQFVSNVADFGMNVQQALEAARFTKSTFDGTDVQIEARVCEAVRGELARRGHTVAAVPAYCSAMGFGSAVVRDSSRRVNFGGSDPRVDGSAHEELACVLE